MWREGGSHVMLKKSDTAPYHAGWNGGLHGTYRMHRRSCFAGHCFSLLPAQYRTLLIPSVGVPVLGCRMDPYDAVPRIKVSKNCG